MRRVLQLILLALALGAGQARAAIVYFESPGFNGASFTAPATFVVQAVAEESGDAVSSLVLFQDGVQVKTGAGTSMYRSVTYTASNLPAGTYYFVAQAKNSQNRTFSKTITVTVSSPNTPPSVQLGAVTGSPFIAPATLGLSASASDSNGVVSKVELLANGQVVATLTAAPYTYTWSGVQPGTYSIAARATDNEGASTTSNAANVTVSASQVIGNFEGVPTDATYAYLVGWACSTGISQPIDVHVYVGGPAGSGAYLSSARADRSSEPGVASACQAGGANYRFSVPIGNSQRAQFAGQPLYVHGISPVGQANSLIAGSGNFTLPAPPPPTKIATFLGQSVPTTVLKGSAFPVSLQFRNDGTAVWRNADSYRLGSRNPENNFTWGASRAPLAADVTSGATANVQFNATAPSTDGVYAFQWQMLQEGTAWFGDVSPNVAVRVVSGSIGASPAVCAIPYGASTCSSTLTWTSSAADAQVWVTDTNNAGDQLVAQAQNGSVAVPWITAAGSRFHLRAAGLTLSTVDVRGNPTANVPPAVNITAPAPGGQGNAPAQLMIRANATDTDDGIASVAFYVNGALLGTDSSSPYEQAWSSVAAGSYTLYAIAKDTRGSATASAAVNVSVGANVPPSAQLTAPASGAQVTAPATIALAATATDSDGSIIGVDFYADATLIATDNVAPYTANWNTAQAGTYSLKAVARDNGGLAGASAVAIVTVRANTPPSVQLTAPASGGQGTAPTTINVAASAADSDGSIAAVDFYADSTLIGTATSAPYSTSWNATQAGTYSLTAVARDNGGAAATSTAVVVSVPAPAPAPPATVQVSAPVVRSYVYDSAQRLCKVIEPETGATVMDYDGAGNLIWSAAGLSGLTSTTSCDRDAPGVAARRVMRTYDARNRLKTLVFPDHRGDQVWNYTPAGQPQSVTTNNDNGGGNVTNTYAYYQNGLLKGETQEQDGYSWSVGYGYDRIGNRSSIVYPAGLTVTFEPNALGQPTRVTGNTTVLASGFSYYPNGAAQSFTYGNGVIHSMTLNARQMPAAVTSSGITSLAYAYDANGNVASIRDMQRGTTYDRTMQYDGLNRLTAVGSCAFGGDCWHRFTYDAVDNIRSWRANGLKDYADYYYDASQRLINIRNSAGAAVVGLEYDAQGNLSNKNGQVYGFDYGNRLRSASGNPSYWYDAYGRRTLASSATGKGYSLYSQEGQLLWERDERSNNRHQYVYLNGTLLATMSRSIGSETYSILYDHTDALGSVVALSDSARTIAQRSEYDPFGALTNRQANNRPGYTGHVMDGSTGLTYMQQRYYDPQIGRFLSVDPVTALDGGQQHFNRYAYAYNNPYKFTDPDGRCPICIPLAVVGRMALGAAIGATVEVGTQVVLDGKRSWSEIDKSDVAVSAAIGAVLPGMGSVAIRAKSAAPAVSRSMKAIRALSQQSRNTVARAEKLAAREAAHVEKAGRAAGDVAETAGAAATGVLLNRFGQEAANAPKRQEAPPPPPPKDEQNRR
ncbi:MAG TPA: Ig-like domain-containing protein [Lysobacter sp.]|nr:Ig-like domain-containing protein [Lysobacter sp.]